jgi:hypothetical protein
VAGIDRFVHSVWWSSTSEQPRALVSFAPAKLGTSLTGSSGQYAACIAPANEGSRSDAERICVAIMDWRNGRRFWGGFRFTKAESCLANAGQRQAFCDAIALVRVFHFGRFCPHTHRPSNGHVQRVGPLEVAFEVRFYRLSQGTIWWTSIFPAGIPMALDHGRGAILGLLYQVTRHMLLRHSGHREWRTGPTSGRWTSGARGNGARGGRDGNGSIGITWSLAGSSSHLVSV